MKYKEFERIISADRMTRYVQACGGDTRNQKLVHEQSYTHTKLIAEMEFGIWKYMFSPVQFNQTGRVLLRVFPNKERSTPDMQYNHSYFFNELDKINTMRNRIAHHEPDSHALLYGLDHVQQVCGRINELKE